ncbi:MAG: carbamoyltransferase HypF [Rhodocyclaceae bacterium]|nr:carbamoyltransferase HypF [Rhodocyclaceae bacterium]
MLPADHIPVPLSVAVPPILALGAWFKNTVCVAHGNTAWVSPSVGDLDRPEACVAHEEAARRLLDWLIGLNESPRIIAHDLHPDFHSSRFAARLAAELGVPAIPVQHHHAHIAALCAEHGVTEPVLGLALDGVGLGTDGAAWGGELLRVEGARFERLGHLRPLALPGGDRAAREPWRMAAAALFDLGRGDEIARRFPDEKNAAALATLLERGVNCPPTSSAGRLFDAAAGLLGLSRRMTMEAEAALLLEQAATRHAVSHGLTFSSGITPASGHEPSLKLRFETEGGWTIDAENRLDLRPALARLADAGIGLDAAETDRAAARFHATLAAALADWALRAAERTGIGIVACGGGCFFNQLLSGALREYFAAAGLRLFEARRLAPGDTAIALGQAWVAAHSSLEH